jgi:hypothetical protein
MEILWVLFLIVLKFLMPVIIVIGVIGGIYSIYRIKNEILSLKAAKGDTYAMELEMMRCKAKLLSFLSYLLGLGGLSGALALGASPYPAIFAGAILFFPLFIWSVNKKISYNHKFKSIFVTAELANIFEKIRYEQFNHISSEEIRALGLLEYVDSISGSDLIEADYNGLHFLQSDLEVLEVWTETEVDRNGHSHEVRRTREIFKGRILKFQFPENFKTEVRVMSKDFNGAADPGSSWENIETELAEFNDRFKVISPDPEAALTVLTPQMIEGIYWVERTIDKPVCFCFKDDSLYTFFDTGDNAFEANRKTLLESRTKLKKDIKLITDFLETMYFKGQNKISESGNGNTQ